MRAGTAGFLAFAKTCYEELCPNDYAIRVNDAVRAATELRIAHCESRPCRDASPNTSSPIQHAVLTSKDWNRKIKELKLPLHQANDLLDWIKAMHPQPYRAARFARRLGTRRRHRPRPAPHQHHGGRHLMRSSQLAQAQVYIDFEYRLDGQQLILCCALVLLPDGRIQRHTIDFRQRHSALAARRAVSYLPRCHLVQLRRIGRDQGVRDGRVRHARDELVLLDGRGHTDRGQPRALLPAQEPQAARRAGAVRHRHGDRRGTQGGRCAT